MADVLGGGCLLALDLAVETPAENHDAPADGEINAGVEVMEEPPVEMLHEAALRSGIHNVLDAAAGDDDELACVREICQETLSRMVQVAAVKSTAHRKECNNGTTDVLGDGSDVVKAFTPPKSPQERLATLNKPRIGRRPSCDSTPAEEIPRWKIIDGNEDPITDITVIFRGDSVPEGFKKARLH